MASAPSRAEAVSKEWPPCPCRSAATRSRTLREYGWLCIPPVHTPSDAHQHSVRAASYPFAPAGGYCLGAWPGATCIGTRSRVVVAVLNNHFHGNPNLDTSAHPSVPESGRHLATGRAPHQPHSASSTASQRCQPCLFPILLFDVAQSQTASLRRAQCARPWPTSRLSSTRQASSPRVRRVAKQQGVNTSCFFRAHCPMRTRPCIKPPT